MQSNEKETTNNSNDFEQEHAVDAVFILEYVFKYIFCILTYMIICRNWLRKQCNRPRRKQRINQKIANMLKIVTRYVYEYIKQRYIFIH